MPKLSKRNEPVKMLLLGNPGTGKTGALACLAKAGFKLVIADFDNGLDILEEEAVLPEKYWDNVDYLTFIDKLRNVAGATIMPVGRPSAIPAFLKALDKWPGLGPIEKLGRDYIFVMDSMSLFCEAALRHAQSINGRPGQKLQQSDWGDAMELTKNVLTILYSDQTTCHVIITSHITYVESEGQAIAGYAASLGQKLPPKIGRYFNTVIQAQRTGDRRKLRTSGGGLVDLKCPKLSLPIQLPINTGLLTIFEAMGAFPPISEKEKQEENIQRQSDQLTQRKKQ